MTCQNKIKQFWTQKTVAQVVSEDNEFDRTGVHKTGQRDKCQCEMLRCSNSEFRLH